MKRCFVVFAIKNVCMKISIMKENYLQPHLHYLKEKRGKFYIVSIKCLDEIWTLFLLQWPICRNYTTCHLHKGIAKTVLSEWAWIWGIIATKQLMQRKTLWVMLFSKEYLFSFKELHAKKMEVGSRRQTTAFYKVSHS